MAVQPQVIRFSRTAKGIAAGVIVLLAIIFLDSVTTILLPFIWAAIVTYLLNPIIRWMTRRTFFNRPVSVTIVFTLLIGTLVLMISTLVPVVVTQYNQLYEAILREGGFLEQATAFIESQEPLVIGGRVIDFKSIEEEIIAALGSVVTVLPATLPDVLATVVESFIHLLVFFVSTFYMLLHADRFLGWFLGLVPAPYRAEIGELVGKIDRVLGAYIRGQFLLIIIMSVASWILLTILDVRFALVIGIATGILEIIPLFGPYMATFIAASVAFFQGTTPFGWSPWLLVAVVIAGYFALRQFEDHVIIPNLLGHIVNLHPVLVLFAILAGGTLAGALGLLISIPVAAVIKILLVYVYNKLIDAPEEAFLPPAPPEEPTSEALRSESQTASPAHS